MNSLPSPERLQDIPFEELVLALRDGGGHSRTWNDLFARILPRVVGAVQRRFPRQDFVLDAVQSACRTFVRRVREGQFQLGDLEAVASVLVGIAYRKCLQMYRHARPELRPAGEEGSRLELVDPQPTPLGGAVERDMETERATLREAMARQLEGMLERVHHLLNDPMHRQIFEQLFQKKYAGQKVTQRAIAVEVGCSERTVRRVWETVQEEWQPLVEEGQRVIRQLEAELTQDGK